MHSCGIKENPTEPPDTGDDHSWIHFPTVTSPVNGFKFLNKQKINKWNFDLNTELIKKIHLPQNQQTPKIIQKPFVPLSELQNPTGFFLCFHRVPVISPQGICFVFIKSPWSKCVISSATGNKFLWAVCVKRSAGVQRVNTGLLPNESSESYLVLLYLHTVHSRHFCSWKPVYIQTQILI